LFMGTVLMVLLIVGRVEVHWGPPLEQDKIDRILQELRNGRGRRERCRNYCKHIIEGFTK
jgi:hypothetical protein